jgi:hypothetical protein
MGGCADAAMGRGGRVRSTALRMPGAIGFDWVCYSGAIAVFGPEMKEIGFVCYSGRGEREGIGPVLTHGADARHGGRGYWDWRLCGDHGLLAMDDWS